MKISLVASLIFVSQLFASLYTIDSFEADFTQNVIDEKNKVLTYKGNVVASKPQSAFWRYTQPVAKDIYINKNRVVIIEPEIEQVILKKIDSDLDFFQIMQHAKEIAPNRYTALFKNTLYTIDVQNNLIGSISYKDEFENTIEITFTNQKQNHTIKKDIFEPKIPLDFDVISE